MNHNVKFTRSERRYMVSIGIFRDLEAISEAECNKSMKKILNDLAIDAKWANKTENMELFNRYRYKS